MRAEDAELNLRWGAICPPTRMKSADGKYYQTQAATLEGVFCFMQSYTLRTKWGTNCPPVQMKAASDYLLPADEAKKGNRGMNHIKET